MARAKLATDRLLECVCVCLCVCMCVYLCMCLCVCVCMCVWGGEALFFRREHQAVEAHPQAILPATASSAVQRVSLPAVGSGREGDSLHHRDKNRGKASLSCETSQVLLGAHSEASS